MSERSSSSNCCGASEPETSERSSSLIDVVGSQKVIFSVALDSGRAHFVCAVVHQYFSPPSRVQWFIMSESDAIVYICTYYDSAN